MKNVTFINAGAGSGKTYTLTKLLSDKLWKKQVNPTQVILTTFTELAASEFREKARRALLSSGQVDAATQIESAYIGTVHSVALRFIKKFWYLLDYGAEIEPISERDEEFYLSQSLARRMSERDENGRLKKEKTLESFRAFRDMYDISDIYGHPDYLFWQNHLKEIVEKMEYYDVKDVTESIEKSKETVEKVFKEPSESASNRYYCYQYIEEIFNLAKEWKEDYSEYKKKNHLISYNDMEMLFLQLITDYDEVKEYVRENFRLVMVDEFQDSNPIQLKIFNQLSELIATEDGHSYWVGDPKQAIYGFRGADTELVKSVTEKFKFYDDAETHPEEGEDNLGSGRLVESWRSREPLVRLVNKVFEHKFDGEIDPLCITLEPHFNDTIKEIALVHWKYTKEKGNRSKKVKPEVLASMVKKLLASKIKVHSGKQDEPVTEIRPKDIAILCRKNSAIEEIVKAMRKIGVPVSEAEDAIMQRIEVQLVVTLLQFVQNPGNKHVIADLMRLLWGNTTEEILKERIKYVLDNNIEEHRSNDKWKEDAVEVIRLKETTERLKGLSIPEMVRAIILECNLPAIAQKWGDGRIRQQNLSTIEHLAEDYDKMCLQMGLGSSISGFIYYLNSIEPDKEKDNQSDTVKVFTYHGSKGLEWPVVILNELDTDALDENDLIKKSFMKVREIVKDDNGNDSDPFAKKYYLHLFPNNLKNHSTHPSDEMKKNIINLPLYSKIKERTKSEEKRLMYVGMTRAKDYLYTVSLEDKLAWLKNIGIGFTDYETIWGVTECKNRVENTTNYEGEIALEGMYCIDKKPDKHTTTRGAKYLSPSTITSFVDNTCIYNSHKVWKERGDEIARLNGGGDFAKIGSCIHDIFAIHKKGMPKDVALRIINGYGLTLTDEEVDGILASADWLYDTLSKHFPQTPEDKTEREVPFTVTLDDGRVVRGEIDMLWHYTENRKKRWVLVDYKSFPGVDLNEHTKKYYAQLSAYAAVLKKTVYDVSNVLVYYPVHRVIHELATL